VSDPPTFPSKEHHDFLRRRLRESGLANFTHQQRFEWQAYVRAWNEEIQGVNWNPCDPNAEWHDPILVKAARQIWAPRAKRSPEPGWPRASADDMAWFEQQDRERRLFAAEFLVGDQLRVQGQPPSDAERDYVSLCMAQVDANLSRRGARPPRAKADIEVLRVIRAELGVGAAEKKDEAA
jgi:hypothetical protein